MGGLIVETNRYLERSSVGVVTTTTVEQQTRSSLKAWRYFDGIRVMYWTGENGSERFIDLSDDQALHFADILRQAVTVPKQPTT